MEISEETSYIPNHNTRPKHSRSVSTVPKHNNNNNNVISSMPKLLIKNLRKKKQKQNHRRQVSITFAGQTNPEKNDIKKTQKNNQLMQFMPSAKNVGSVMSYLFRKNKKTKKSQDNPGLGKQGSVSVQCSTPSISTLFRDRKNKKNGLKSVKGKEECKGKSGLIIRGLTKMRSREKERFELCKKNILMGEKCRPLNGVTLRYDKNGVLVPDEDLTT